MSGTVVLMMAVQNAPAIAAALVAGGRAADHAGRGRLRRHDAGGAHRAGDAGHAGGRAPGRARSRPPAIIVVGGVVAVAHREHFS